MLAEIAEGSYELPHQRMVGILAKNLGQVRDVEGD